MYTIFGGFRDVEDRPERTICLEELRRRIARLEAPRQRGPRSAGAERLRGPGPAPARGGISPRHPGRVAFGGRGDRGGHVGPAGGQRSLPATAGCWPCSTRRRRVLPHGRRPAGNRPGATAGGSCPRARPTTIGPSTRCCARRPWPRCWPGRRRLDARTFRRWQLAAEEGGSWACCCGRRRHAPSPPGPTCGCWSSRCRLQAVSRSTRKRHGTTSQPAADHSAAVPRGNRRPQRGRGTRR